MAWDDSWRLGPLGNLHIIPSPSTAEGAEVEPTRIGATHTALYGRRTRDTFSIQREWVISWPILDHADTLTMRALASDLSTTPLRLIDPFSLNRLQADVAATGSQTRTADRFTTGEAVGAGTVEFTTTNDPPVDFIDGALEWTVPDGESGTLLTDVTDTIDRVPLIEGEEITFSVYAIGEGEVSATLVPLDDDGIEQTAQTGVGAALGSVWQRLSVTYTPVAGEVSASVGLSVTSDNAERVVTTTAWQSETGATASDWEIGAGAPEVLVDITGDTYRNFNRHAFELTLTEV